MNPFEFGMATLICLGSGNGCSTTQMGCRAIRSKGQPQAIWKTHGTEFNDLCIFIFAFMCECLVASCVWIDNPGRLQKMKMAMIVFVPSLAAHTGIKGTALHATTSHSPCRYKASTTTPVLMLTLTQLPLIRSHFHKKARSCQNLTQTRRKKEWGPTTKDDSVSSCIK